MFILPVGFTTKQIRINKLRKINNQRVIQTYILVIYRKKVVYVFFSRSSDTAYINLNGSIVPNYSTVKTKTHRRVNNYQRTMETFKIFS